MAPPANRERHILARAHISQAVVAREAGERLVSHQCARDLPSPIGATDLAGDPRFQQLERRAVVIHVRPAVTRRDAPAQSPQQARALAVDAQNRAVAVQIAVEEPGG